MQVNIVYWSGTGNTEKMAELIKEGIESAGASVLLKNVADASDADLECDVLVLGCPSMGDEVLEESEFEPFIEGIESKVSGKKVALFGSYGWGDGQWMRDWTERMEKAGALLALESLIVNDSPDGEAVGACKDFGIKIAQQ
jgi:flavodoxin, short chain